MRKFWLSAFQALRNWYLFLSCAKVQVFVLEMQNLILFIFCLTLNKKPSGENLNKCKGSVNTLLKCCAITGNRSTTIESHCLQNGSWTPVDLNCVPNQGNLLKIIVNKTVMGQGFSRLHLLFTYFLFSVTQRAKCSKMVQNCIFPIHLVLFLL